jgi:hypothetical protein
MSTETQSAILCFGKYEGKDINEIEDMDYLHSLLEDKKLDEKVKEIIQKRIDKFEFLAK